MRDSVRRVAVPPGLAMTERLANGAHAVSALQRRKLELGTFLRQRRTALRPQDVGLTPIGRRHVKGLRREELAAVAGISASWYTLLEQGRAETVAPRTIAALADALRLTRTERAHLHDLASNSFEDLAVDFAPPPDGMLDFVRAYPAAPAHLNARCFDVVAWNAPAAEMFFIEDHLPNPNLLRIMVDEPRMRAVFVEPAWKTVLGMMIGHFRILYAQYGGADFDALSDELRAKSPAFDIVLERARGLRTAAESDHDRASAARGRQNGRLRIHHSGSAELLSGPHGAGISGVRRSAPYAGT